MTGIRNQIESAWHWWLEGLLAWFPTSLQAKLRAKPYIECRLSATEIVLSYYNQQAVASDRQVFAAGDADDPKLRDWLSNYRECPCKLIINEQESLVTMIDLPRQAISSLDEVMKFEIDRHTPFSIDDVYFGATSGALENNDSNLVTSHLAVVPQKTVDALLAISDQHAISISTVLVEHEGGFIELKGLAQTAPVEKQFYINAVLVVLMFVLFALFLYKPVSFFNEQSVLLEPELASLKKQALPLNELRKEAQSLQDKVAFIEQQMKSYHYKTELLQQLTLLLPEHTWLTSLDIVSNKVIIKGQSQQATALIALLMKSGKFESAHFVSAIQQNITTGKDLFHLEATLLTNLAVQK